MTDFATVGDYARQLVQRRQNADIRARMDTLTSEVGSGRIADLSGALRGDFTRLASFEGDLAQLDAFSRAAAELGTRAATAQTALDAVAAATRDFAGDLLAAPAGDPAGRAALATEARNRFATVVGALNADLAGSAVFAGTASGGPALAPAEDMLSAVAAEVAAAPDAAAAAMAVRDWFAPGGGFDASGYLGGAPAATEVPVGPGERARLDVTADAAAFREMLSSLALATLSGTGPLAGPGAPERDLLIGAGEGLAGAQSGLASLRSGIGALEARLEAATTRNAAAATALEVARGALTEVDVYDSATELQAVQGQLELLYAITARNARLSLVEAL